MCGIVGLYLKNRELEPELGRLTALMLHEMSSRGPDSAGFAVYGEGGASKVSASQPGPRIPSCFPQSMPAPFRISRSTMW